MLVKVLGSAVIGVDAITISIECDLAAGSGYFIVGLPDIAVKESIERILAAFQNNGFLRPRRKVVINMAPADLKKEGAAYDLPIAIGILASTHQIDHEHLNQYMIMGELAFDGSLRPIKGALPIAIQARKEKFKGLILPKENAREAALVNELEVYGCQHINEVIEIITAKPPLHQPVKVNTRDDFFAALDDFQFDFNEVKGQENIKRALEIAAAGGHNAILIGPPGSGKTMLAKRLPSILPPLSLQEALESTKIHSVAGRLQNSIGLISERPFRSPHHTVSDVALVGGGSYPQPGEISLAHNGVLFLDELPEFKRTALEVMRQPMEERRVTISRAKVTVDFPSNFMLIASMNPCPCGYYNHPVKECSCSSVHVQRYLNKVSGPLLDRIDLHVEVTPVPFKELSSNERSESSVEIRKRVIEARNIQKKRFESWPYIHANAMMGHQQIQQFCKLDPISIQLLKKAMERLNLSARAYDRILKVSRTIADLAGKEAIHAEHIAEAIQYRSLDRESWAG